MTRSWARGCLTGSATPSVFLRTLRERPRLPSSPNFRRIWNPHTIPGLPPSRRRGVGLTGSPPPPPGRPPHSPHAPRRNREALPRQCRSALDELTFLAPWILLPAAPGRLSAFPDIGEIPTLRQLARLEAELLPAIGRRRGRGPPPAGSRPPRQ